MTVSTTYSVSGMSCQHCVDAVTDELTKLAPVEGVQVDLGSGTVTVTSAGPVDRELVRSAVDEAGYDLVDDGS